MLLRSKRNVISSEQARAQPSKNKESGNKLKLNKHNKNKNTEETEDKPHGKVVETENKRKIEKSHPKKLINSSNQTNKRSSTRTKFPPCK